jgi:predicted transposase/invertase (TIGR01784 family)
MTYVTSVEKIGIKIGRQEGRQEGRETTQREIALKMLAKGMSAEDITSLTGLSMSEVERFANEKVQSQQG